MYHLISMVLLQCISIFNQQKMTTYRGGGSVGATGAWAPAEIWQRVPGTHPKKNLRFQQTYFLKNVKTFLIESRTQLSFWKNKAKPWKSFELDTRPLKVLKWPLT